MFLSSLIRILLITFSFLTLSICSDPSAPHVSSYVCTCANKVKHRTSAHTYKLVATIKVHVSIKVKNTEDMHEIQYSRQIYDDAVLYILYIIRQRCYMLI